MTRSEQKLREPVPVLVPVDPEGESGRRNGDFPERDGSSVMPIDGSSGVAGGVDTGPVGPANGSVRKAFGVETGPSDGRRGTGESQAPDAGGVGPHEVNQSLARLEMNSLQVKLYLDSIDQRISRMEPRLEGMRGAEQESAEDVEKRVAEGPATAGVNDRFAGDDRSPAGVDAPPTLPTSERRRRAQGVPVERRRAPHAVPGVIDEGEPWAWEWKSWVGGLRPWLLAHRVWAPVVLAGLLAVVGLVYWSASRPAPVQSPTGNADARAGSTGPAAGTAQKSSAEMPWGTGAGSGQGRTGRPGIPNHAAEARPAKTIVEQGVIVPLARPGSSVAPGVPSGPGAEATPSAEVARTNSTPAVLGDTAGARSGENIPGSQTGSHPATAPAVEANAPDSSLSNSGPSRPGTSGKIIPPSPSRVHVSSGVMAGSLTYSPPPTYPHGFARLFHTEGRVVMQAIISKNGRVENLRVISGHYMLRGAAKDAVRTWRYKPYHVNGSAVEVATIVSVEFQR